MSSRSIRTAEFGQDAVHLARTNGTLSSTACDLGIDASLLRQWMNAEQDKRPSAFPGQEKQRLTSDQQDTERRCKANTIVYQEREILNRAAACLEQNGTRIGPARFFAKEATR